MKLVDIMTTPVIGIGPSENLRQAADVMKVAGCRFLPVLVKGSPIGYVTVEDLTIGIVADGLPADKTCVGQLSMRRPLCLDQNIDIEDAASEMARAHARHIVVVDRDSNAIGIVGLTEIACHASDATLGRTMRRLLESEINRYPITDFIFSLPGIRV